MRARKLLKYHILIKIYKNKYNATRMQAPKQKMSSNQIYQYLLNKNFNLSSDRVLKQPHLNQQVIWNILAFLSNNLKDTKYQQIQPFIYNYLNPEVNKNCLKRVKQYITISQVLKKSTQNNEQYPIKQILKPDRESLLQKITALINANKFYQKITKQFENIRVENKLKKQLVQQLRRKHETRLLQIQEVKAIKQKQKNLYEQKKLSIQNLQMELNYKKKQKLDLLNSQQSLDNQLKKKNKGVSQLGYANDDLNIKIKQLERQVIKNAPKLKKQRFALIETYESLMKSSKEQFQMWNNKISVLNDKIKPFAGMKQKSKIFKIEQRIRQLQKMSAQLANLTNAANNDQQLKQGSMATKKQFLKSIQNLQKDKKQLNQQIMQQQRQLSLLQASQKLLKEEERKFSANVNILEGKNNLAKNQHKALQQKIRHRIEKHKQKMFEMMFRLNNIETESKSIIEQAFAEFN